MLKETNIQREKLQQTLKQNLTDHIQIFDLALAGWQKEYQKYVKDFSKKVKSGDFKVSFRPPLKPNSYAKNYEDVISQLDMSADEVITLNAVEFQNYILDEWNFSASFYTPFVTASSFNANFETLSLSNQTKLSKYISD
jgi:hypothetical protein